MDDSITTSIDDGPIEGIVGNGYHHHDNHHHDNHDNESSDERPSHIITTTSNTSHGQEPLQPCTVFSFITDSNDTATSSSLQDTQSTVFSFVKEKDGSIDEEMTATFFEQRRLQENEQRRLAEIENERVAELDRKEQDIKREKKERRLFKHEDEHATALEVDRRQRDRLKKKRRARRQMKIEEMNKRKYEERLVQQEATSSSIDAVADTQHDDCDTTQHIEEKTEPSTGYGSISDLFDMSTVRHGSIDDDRQTKKVIKREKVKLQRLVLGRSGVHLQDDEYVLLEVCEKPKKTFPVKLETLKFNISKDCTTAGALQGNSPSMPLLRLEMLEKEWQEPVRSRDKNWVLHSQRQILLSDSGADNDYNTYKDMVRNKKYETETELANSTWHSSCKTFVRTVRLARESFRVSETNCLVTIYGTGVNGRLFGSKGSGQMIKMDIFSFWNSEKFSFSFTLADIKRLFIDRPDLLKAGCKDRIIRGLLKRLYFKYTITATSPPELDNQTVHVIEVTHLEKPLLPQFLHSSSVMDIITKIQGGQELLSFPVPMLKQELKIGTEERPNGMLKRLSEYKELQRRLEEEERLKGERWLATPKRLRGFVHSHLIRAKGHFVIVSSYRMPNRMGNIIVKGITPISCRKLGHYLGLSYLGQIFGIKESAKKWDEEFVFGVVRKALRSLKISDKVVVEEMEKHKQYALCIEDNNGTDVSLGKLAHCDRSQVHTMRIARIHTSDSVSDNMKVSNYFSRYTAMEELDKNHRRVVPRRHIGLGKTHLTTRSVKIDGVYCIYSAYIRNMKWKVLSTAFAGDDENGSKTTDKNDPYKTTAFDIDFEFYVPHDSQVEGHQLPQSSIFKISFCKDDFFFFTDNEHLSRLQAALDVLEDDFFLKTSPVLLEHVQEEWSFLCAKIVSKAHFRLRYHESSVEAGLLTKIHKANRMMCMDARNTLESPADDNIWPPVPYIALAFPISVVCNKTMVVQSVDENRPKPYLTSSMWVKGRTMGVIVYDSVLKDIYFMEPVPAVQTAQIDSLRWLPSKDRVISASLFVQYSTIWVSIFDENGTYVRSELQWADMGDDAVDGSNNSKQDNNESQSEEKAFDFAQF